MPHLTRRSLLLAGLGALPALVACSLPGQSPATPSATPTPRPTATMTPAAIAVPSRAIIPSAGPRRTAVRTPIPELLGAGELLYISRVPETPGVVLAEAGGARRRLLVPGDYGRVAWSPDGGRIAVTGPYTSPATRVDLFDPAGRVLQRVALEGIQLDRPKWTRAGGHVLISVVVPPESNPGGRSSRYWIISEGEGRSSGQDGLVELDLGGPLTVGDWSATGRLAVAVNQGQPSGIVTYALWTVDATGADARRLAVGGFVPSGWSPDGLTLYARGEFVPVRDPDGTRYSPPTSLFAINERDGPIRRVVGLAEIAAQLSAAGVRLPRPLRILHAVAPSPGGGHVALWCALEPTPAGSQGPATAFVVVILDAAGRLLWWDPVSAPPTDFFILPGWSPTSKRLAYAFGNKSGFSALHVVTPATGDEATIELSGLDLPQWSPDGRWLAAVTKRGLEIVEGSPPHRSYPLAVSGISPSWNPKGR